jgi:hypothetical protein
MMQIRFADPEDARAVAEIHVEAWRAAYAGILPEAFLAALTVSSREAFWEQVLAENKVTYRWPWRVTACWGGSIPGLVEMRVRHLKKLKFALFMYRPLPGQKV